MRWIKRTLLLLCGLIGCVLLGLYLARFRAGYALISESIDLAAPPAEVFHYISSPETAKTWIPGLSDVQSLTPGKTGVGAKDKMVMAIGGDRTELEMEVAVFEPDRRIELIERPLNTPDMDFRARIVYTLEPIAAGTCLTESSRTEYRSELGRLLEPIISRQAGAMLRDLQQNLKRVIESRLSATGQRSASGATR